jgi:hypothetical protein
VLAASIFFRLDDGLMSFNDSGLNIECNYFAQDFGLISSPLVSSVWWLSSSLIQQWVKYISRFQSKIILHVAGYWYCLIQSISLVDFGDKVPRRLYSGLTCCFRAIVIIVPPTKVPPLHSITTSNPCWLLNVPSPISLPPWCLHFHFNLSLGNNIHPTRLYCTHSKKSQ